MLPSKHSPEHLAPETLDLYLARGWFRMQQDIFITHFLQFGGRLYDALWLRLVMSDFQWSEKQQKHRRHCQRFTTLTEPYVWSQDMEDLYALYRESVRFEAAQDLNELLGEPGKNIFDTRVVKIFDGIHLIAAGFFDVGGKSVAGISSIYHPDYRRYSLGKYLVLCKLDFCLQEGMQYFYPGYIVPGHERFDYKMEIAPDVSEYYDAALEQWRPLASLDLANTPLATMYRQMSMLQQYLQNQGVVTSLQTYRYFDARLWFPFKGELLAFPLYLRLVWQEKQLAYDLIIWNWTETRFEHWLCLAAYHFTGPADSDNMILSPIALMGHTTSLAEAAQMITE
jgi:arginine-tRNA-protein transferase